MIYCEIFYEIWVFIKDKLQSCSPKTIIYPKKKKPEEEPEDEYVLIKII